MNKRDFLAGGGAATLSLSFAHRAFAQASFGLRLTQRGTEVLNETMQLVVETGDVPGAVWLVARGNDVQVGAAGTFGAEGASHPMARDTIFRIASLSKPIMATAVMMLVEEGKVALDEPVDRLIPELAGRRVLTAIEAPLDSTVPAERAILVRDLLTFTMGFGVQFDPTLPIEQAIGRHQLANGYPFPITPHDPDEWIRRLGTLPLMAQPGATWLYNTGSLVQGVLVARASGQPIDAFLKARIFEPLDMVDTGFVVPPEQRDRLPPLYAMNFETGAVYLEDAPDGVWSDSPPFPSVSPGLVSTIDDFLTFARMLMNKGVHEGSRLLSEASVAAMTRDQLTAEQKAGAGFTPEFFDTRGWGYGMAVWTAPDPLAPNPGRYGWDGGFGTSWANDPATGLIGILMTQSAAYYVGAKDFVDFWSAANGALET